MALGTKRLTAARAIKSGCAEWKRSILAGDSLEKAVEAGDLKLLQSRPIQLPHAHASGRHTLLRAARNQLSTLRYLIDECRLDPIEDVHHDWTPILFAAERDDVDMIRYLISVGADANALSDEGATALHSIQSVECG